MARSSAAAARLPGPSCLLDTVQRTAGIWVLRRLQRSRETRAAAAFSMYDTLRCVAVMPALGVQEAQYPCRHRLSHLAA